MSSWLTRNHVDPHSTVVRKTAPSNLLNSPARKPFEDRSINSPGGNIKFKVKSETSNAIEAIDDLTNYDYCSYVEEKDNFIDINFIPNQISSKNLSRTFFNFYTRNIEKVEKPNYQVDMNVSAHIYQKHDSEEDEMFPQLIEECDDVPFPSL